MNVAGIHAPARVSTRGCCIAVFPAEATLIGLASGGEVISESLGRSIIVVDRDDRRFAATNHAIPAAISSSGAGLSRISRIKITRKVSHRTFASIVDDLINHFTGAYPESQFLQRPRQTTAGLLGFSFKLLAVRPHDRSSVENFATSASC